MQAQGLVKGDRIALMMPNLLQYPVTLIAALRLGLVVVNVNPLFTPKELLHELADAKPNAIVIFSHFANTLKAVIKDYPGLQVITTEYADLFPMLKRYFTHFAIKCILRLAPRVCLKGAIAFPKALALGKTFTFKKVSSSLEDLAFLQYTGGTTGTPKAAMLTQGNLLANVEQVHAWFKPNVTVGKEVLITNPKDIKGLIKRMSKTPFTGMIALNALLDEPRFAGLDFSHLHLAIAGGAALMQPVGYL